MEQQRIVNTEVEWERVSVMVQEAYKLWSQDSTNSEAEEKMNQALNEAYGTGVRIAVKVERQALGSPDVFSLAIYDKLRKLDPWIQDEVVLSTVKDNPRSSRIYRGHVLTTKDTGYLSLDVIARGNSINFATLEPGEIASFTPIRPTR